MFVFALSSSVTNRAERGTVKNTLIVCDIHKVGSSVCEDIVITLNFKVATNETHRDTEDPAQPAVPVFACDQETERHHTSVRLHSRHNANHGECRLGCLT